MEVSDPQKYVRGVVLPAILATGKTVEEWLAEHYYAPGCNLKTASEALGIRDKRTLWTWLRNNGHATKQQSEAQSGSLNSFYGRTHRKESKQATGNESSRRNAGSGNPAWIDGRASYRRTTVPASTARCEHCGEELPALHIHVHHINKDRHDNRPQNLRVLCAECHRLHHNHERAIRAAELAQARVLMYERQLEEKRQKT